MLQVLWRDSKKREQYQRSWLADRVSAYLRDLAARGYKEKTLQTYGRALIQFGEFLKQRGVCDVTKILVWIEPFVLQHELSVYGARNWRSMLSRFVRYLRRQGLIHTPDVPPSTVPHGKLIDQYIQFQYEHRGICTEYAKNVRRCCTAFITYLTDCNVRYLGAIRPNAIHEFVILEGRRYCRKTMSGRCYALRGFLRYLFRRGITSRDMSPLVVTPRLFKHEQCPRFLTHSEVRRVLAMVDRQTPQGRRDYAMLCLLSTYGLRGIEVIRLLLDNIDWRHERLYIRSRKAGNNTVYPLATSVGNAILAYLENSRPQSQHRHVFLSVKAPFAPLVYTYAVGYLVRRYIAQAGISVDRPGTHTFRYSCAQRLLDRGMTLKCIGDYLGHRDPDSTQRYTKIGLKQLREVACNDGEDLL